MDAPTSSLFADEPSRLRRLVLVLYLVVGPVFAAVLFSLAEPGRALWALSSVSALIVSGLVVLHVVRRPGPLSWVWVGVVVPELSCGLAGVATGAHGPAFIAVLGAPIAWSVVLFDATVSTWGLVVSVGVCFAALATQTSGPEAAQNTLVFGTIYGLVAWVGRSKGTFLRDARQQADDERRRVSALLDAIPDVVARADEQGRFLDLSVPTPTALPRPREELLGKSVYELVPDSVAREMRVAIARTLETGELQHVQYSANYADGTRWFEARFARSGPREVLVLRQDVTSAYRVREERELLGALEQHMAEAVIVIGLDHRVLQWSPGAVALYGWPAVEVIGKPITDLISATTAAQLDDVLAALTRGDTLPRAERSRTRRDGTPMITETTFALLRDVRGAPRAVLAVSRDVTTVVRERERELERARMLSLGQRMNEVEFVFKRDGQLVHANDQALATYGYSRDELLALNVRDLRAPGTQSLVPEQLDQAIAAGVRFETVHRRKDGSLFPVEISASGVVVGGEPLLHTLARDLTSQRATERALRESEARLQSIFSAMAEGVVLQDAAGRVVTCNHAAERILGATREQMTGHASDSPQFQAAREDGSPFPANEHPSMVALRTGKPQSGVIMRLTVQGQAPRWLSLSSEPLGDPASDRPHAVVTTITDVSELRHGAELVRASEERIQRAMEGSRDGFFELDVATGTVTRSDRVARMLGREPDALAGTIDAWLALIHPDDAPRLKAAIRQVVGGESPQLNEEFRAMAADGSWRWLQGRARRFTEPSTGGTWRVSGVVTDVTEQHEASAKLKQSVAENAALVEELRAATARAQSANLLKGQFLSNMSHEIRTPLNAVIGFSRLGLEEESPARLKDYNATIHRSASSLLSLVNDILDVAKIEAGKLTLEHIPFDLRALVGEVLDAFEATADAKHVLLVRALDPGLPAIVVGDPLRTRQVLSNLVSNALKFTERGRVEVQVGPGSSTGSAVLVVRDTGIGMTADEIARLFTAFSQADASTTRRFGGTGLGLAISKNLARAMGGDLSVSSAPGVGSTFTFVLAVTAPTPAERAEFAARRPDAPLPRPEVLVGSRVLLAEDNKVNQFLARTLLEKVGAVVTVVDDGTKAVDAVLRAPGAFDVVLMDIQMPEVDGLEAARRIRAALDLAAPPIIAMTANAMPEQREQSLASGMVEHISKPIDPRRLYQVLERVLSAPDRGAAPGARPEPRRVAELA